MFDSESDSQEHILIARPEAAVSAESTSTVSETVRRTALGPVASTDPATRVMTDFAAQTPLLVAAERSIDDALREMMSAGVRALLVTQGEVIIGLITSYDIQGERPLQFLNTSGFTRHDEIQVGHIMTPWARVPKLEWRWVRAARVRDVAERFKAQRTTTHFIVFDRVARGDTVVRGLLSRTHLERQLAR